MFIRRVTALVCGLAIGGGATAATFTVDNFVDLNDASPGNGVCDVGDGTCSFRAAAQEAQALTGFDTILLAAGTHQLSQTYNCGGSQICGRHVEFYNQDVEVVGAGAGVSVIQATEINYGGKVIDVLAGGGTIRFADLTVNAGVNNTPMISTGGACSQCGLVLDGVELKASFTNSIAFFSLLALSGTHPTSLHNSSINVDGVAGNFFYGIIANGGGNMLIEDSHIDGGHAASIGLHYRPSSSASTLTVRRSRFSAIANTGADAAAIQLFNVSGGGGAQVSVEDSEFVSVARGVQLKNFGHVLNVAIERSLFTNVPAQAVLLSGPGSGSILNSTISSAATGVALTTPAGGAGTYALTLDSVTIAGGSTSVDIGSGLGTVAARNSILADAGTAACSGTLDSLGHNLIEGACSVAGDTTGNVVGADPMLDALADNGGATQTRALAEGSPAIDAGDAAQCPTQDQRAYSRPADGDGDLDARCDIGAFEKDAIPAPTNTAPQPSDDDVSVNEDAAVEITAATLLANDVDGEDDAVVITVNSGTTAQGGVFSCDAAGCSYQPANDFFGADDFDYEVCDDGVPSLCGSATVDVTVLPVNDPPSFLPGPAQVFPAGSSGAQSADGWASSIDLGPAESGQSVQAFELSLLSDPGGVVAGLPAIDAFGNLGFTLSGLSGEASFEVVLRDDGGTANGGSDVSAAALLSIAVGTAADLAIIFQQCTERAAPDAIYAYAMRFENAGPDSALDVVLDAPLPTGAMVDSIVNASCMEAGDSVVCHVAQLAVGSGVAVPVRLLMPDGGPATLALTATASAATDDPVAGNSSSMTSVELIPGFIVDLGFESCSGVDE